MNVLELKGNLMILLGHSMTGHQFPALPRHLFSTNSLPFEIFTWFQHPSK